MAFCSAVTLCFASIFSLVSAALLAIAFSTDNWQNISVRRENLQVRNVVYVLYWIVGTKQNHRTSFWIDSHSYVDT